jgi:Fe-Mn family superoxide dismutase
MSAPRKINRRQWIKTTVAAIGAVPLTSLSQTNSTNKPTIQRPSKRSPQSASDQDATPLQVPFPPLPYDPDALEHFISRQIIDLHYGRHHASYHKKFQEAVDQLNLKSSTSIESILRNIDTYPEDIRLTLRNQGGGHYNHNLYWKCMKRNGGGRPIDELGNAINQAFGNYESFVDQFTKISLSVFGSGWCWLCLTQDQTITIETTPNQDNPIMQGRIPIFGIDLWEHAYYLQYHHRRADYIDSFFKIINWDYICDRYRKITTSSSTTSPLTDLS